MLVDTDVLIWHLRGYAQARRRLDELESLTISAVTYLELVQGIRNKTELAALKKMLERRQAVILPLTEAITQHAIALMESLALSREPESYRKTRNYGIFPVGSRNRRMRRFPRSARDSSLKRRTSSCCRTRSEVEGTGSIQRVVLFWSREASMLRPSNR